MPAKQKGSNQKKRSQRQHSIEQQHLSTRSYTNPSPPPPDPAIVSPNDVGENRSRPSITIVDTSSCAPSSQIPHTESFTSARSMDASQQDRVMQSRREFVFGSLVGHRITVLLRDGTEISGIFALHGNQAMLPHSWTSESKPPNSCSPLPENVYTYVAPPSKFSCVANEDGSEEPGGAWFVAGRKKKASKKPPREGDSGREDDATSSSSSFVTPVAGGTFELYHSEARTANVKQPCIWLRCAYRVAGAVAKSSGVYDWVVVPWQDVVCLEAENIPDNPDEYKSFNAPSAFHTDAEIARSGQVVERYLERWDGGGEDFGVALEDGGALSWPSQDKANRRGSAAEVWDQFECNAKKFGVHSTYVEGMYSTDLDVNSIPEDYQKHAEKIADEVENSNGRRLRVLGGGRLIYRSDDEDDIDDEEARFSAVVGTGRYANKSFLGSRLLPQDPGKLGVGGCPSRRFVGRGRGRPALVEIVRQHQQQQQPSSEHHQQKVSTRAYQQQHARDGSILKRQSSSYSSSEHKSRPQPTHDETSYENQSYAAAGPYPPKMKTSPHDVSPPTNMSALPPKPEGGEAAPPEGNEASQRNLKDNLNALNLEPTKTKKHPTHMKMSAEGAASRQKTRSEETKKDRKAMIEQLLASSKKIDDCLARKGWLIKDPCPPSPPKQESGSVETGSAGSASTGLPRPGTAAHIDSSANPTTSKAEPTHTSGSGSATPVVPTLPLPDNDEHHLKRGFQFNPNANSFTPKGNTTASPTVKPTAEVDRQVSIGSSQQQRNSPTGVSTAAPDSQSSFLPFHAGTAELRRKLRLGAGDRHSVECGAESSTDTAETDGGLDFFDSFIRASRQSSEVQATAQVSHEWESRYPASFLDVLNPPQCTTHLMNNLAPAVLIPTVPQIPTLLQPPLVASDSHAGCLPHQQGLGPQPQAPFPQMAPAAMFGFPAMRSVFPQAAFNPVPGGMDPSQPTMQVFMNPAAAARVGDPVAAAQMYNPAAFGPEYLTAYNPALNAQMQQQQHQQQRASMQQHESQHKDATGDAKRDDVGDSSSPSPEKHREMLKNETNASVSQATGSDEVSMMQGGMAAGSMPVLGLHTLAAGSGQMPILFAQQQSLLPPTATFPPQVYLMYQQQALLQQQAAFQQLQKHPNLLPQQSVTLVNPMQFLHQPTMLARPGGAGGDPNGRANNMSRLRNTPSQTSLVGVPIDQHVPVSTTDASGAHPTMAAAYASQEGMFAGYGGHMPGVFPPQAAGVFPSVRGLYWQQ